MEQQTMHRKAFPASADLLFHRSVHQRWGDNSYRPHQGPPLDREEHMKRIPPAVITFVVLVAAVVVVCVGITSYSNDWTRKAVQANMSAFRVAAENYAARHDGAYSSSAYWVADYLSKRITNPLDGTSLGWNNQPWMNGIPTGLCMVGYAASADTAFVIYGTDRKGKLLPFTLTNKRR